MRQQSEPQAVRIWDLPTRVFHWALVLCVIGSVLSAKIGGNAMDWHLRLGYGAFALLLFRLLWGVVGGYWSRFITFLYSPATTWRYLRGRTRPEDGFDVGHSPLAALSVFAMLLILAAQVGTGLFADDEIATSGPLVRFVSDASSQALTAYHKQWGQWAILLLVALHVGAVIFQELRGSKALVRSMLTGDKLLDHSAPTSKDDWASRGLALLLLLACAGLVAWLVDWGQRMGS